MSSFVGCSLVPLSLPHSVSSIMESTTIGKGNIIIIIPAADADTISKIGLQETHT